jgi:carboxymethylenebutenolidase
MIKSEMLTVNGHPMELQVGIPDGNGPFPTLLLMYHRGGFDKFTRNRLEALVGEGFLTAVPDIYFRAPKDAEDRKTFLKDSDAVAAIKAAYTYAEKHPQTAKGQIGIIGHCMGGRLTLQGASVLPNLKVAAVFYGGGVFVSWGNEGPPPAEFLGNIRCPVIGFFGGQDTNPSPEQVDKIDGILTKHGIPHIFHRYPKVGHGFQQIALGRGGDAEREASDDAWAKMKAFVSQKMGAPAAVS